MTDEQLKELNEYVFDIDDKPKTHTLKCLDNEKRPIQLQMRVTIVPISAADSDKANKEAYALTGQRNKLSEEEWQAKYLANWIKLQFKEKIQKLENIVFKINGKPKLINDPIELYHIKDSKALEIINEIKSLFNDDFKGEEKKN